jgi:hypothetical protein
MYLKRLQLLLSLLLFTSCQPDEYAYVKPTPTFTVETVLEDGTPVSVEVPYEQLHYCEDGEPFKYPDYVTTDSECAAGITIQDGRYYKR